MALGKIPDGAAVLSDAVPAHARARADLRPDVVRRGAADLLLGYVALRAALGPQRLERARPFPSNRALATAALGTGAAALLLRLRWPAGEAVLSLQIGYFASYVVLSNATPVCTARKSMHVPNFRG